jgi:hypothetical protein
MAAPALVNHLPLVAELCDKLTQLHIDRVDRERLRSSEDQFFLDYVDRPTAWTGNKRMERIMQLCNNVPGYDLSPFQKMCLKEILQCMSPVIFGNPSANELAMYLRKYGMQVPRKKMVFIGTSRRGGKTDIMTMSAASMLATVPHLNLLYFSIYNLTCEVACSTVKQWLDDWGLGDRVHKRKLQLTVRGDTPDDVRTIIFINGQTTDVPTPAPCFALYALAFCPAAARRAAPQVMRTPASTRV